MNVITAIGNGATEGGDAKCATTIFPAIFSAAKVVPFLLAIDVARTVFNPSCTALVRFTRLRV